MTSRRAAARLLLLALTLLAACAGPRLDPAGGTAAPDAYRLAPKDVLEITISEEPEMSRKASIRADGTIDLALVGRIELAGLTSREAEAAIEKRLGRFFVAPRAKILLAR